MAKCGRCKCEGHNERTCPDQESPVTRRVADLRLQSDALATEIVQYQAVRDTVEQRIFENRKRIAEVAILIQRLRSGSATEVLS